jgi:hypothetical protein
MSFDRACKILYTALAATCVASGVAIEWAKRAARGR